MQFRGFSFLSAPLILCTLAVAPRACAQPAGEFYKGKQIVLASGNAAGDRGDVVARLFLKHMSRHIPGAPPIVIQNMPGAGTLVVTNYLYNTAARDGTVIGKFSGNIPVQAIIGQPSVHYDPRRLGWLGSPQIADQICIANASARVKTAQDLFEKELIVGGTGVTTVGQYVPLVLNNTLGMKFKIVGGYKGIADTLLAVDRGELEGACVYLDDLAGEWLGKIADGGIRVLFHSASKPSPLLPGVPSIYDFVKTEAQRQVIFFVNAGIEFGRPFATPPDVPPDRFAALKQAFAETIDDPVFLADAEQSHVEVGFISGDRMDKLVNDLYATPRELVEVSAAMMGYSKP